MSRLAPVLTLLAVFSTSLVFGSGCNSHPLTNYDAGPQIDENGISVPVPPPSLTLMPVQQVDIVGQLRASAGGAGTRVFLLETQGGLPALVVSPEADNSFFFEGVEIDLSDNCLEVWSEDAQARPSVRAFYRASIGDDDQSVITDKLFNGCP